MDGLDRIAAEIKRHRRPVGFLHQFTRQPGILILSVQAVQQGGQGSSIGGEPVETFRWEQLGEQKGCRSRMAQVITLRQIAEPIRLGQWTMPRKPALPAGVLHLNIRDKFTQIV